MGKFLRFFPRRFHFYASEYGAGFILIGALIAACVMFFVYYDPSPVIRRDYLTAEVVSIMDTSSDKSITTDAIIKLPDQTLGHVRANGIAQAQWLLHPVCVAKLTRKNGRITYRLEPHRRCTELPHVGLS